MLLDEKDHKILAALMKDSRKTVRELSKETKIRPSTIHRRIQELVKRGVIERFTLKVNHKRFGDSFVAFMLLTTSNEVPQEFIAGNQVREVFGITGEYDLVLKLRFKGVEEFNDFVLNLRKHPYIRKTLTMVVTASIKEEI